MTTGLSVTQFETDGFAPPLPVLSPQQCERLLEHVNSVGKPEAAVWHKGLAVTDRLIYEVTTTPSLMRAVKAILGENVIVWGATIVSRSPSELHPWHTDIEASCNKPGMLTAWIGLENTCSDSSIQLIRASHLYGEALQRSAARHSVPRKDINAETAMNLAKEHSDTVEIIKPELDNGLALLFDGRIWHGSFNSRKTGIRTALVIHYAASSRVIRIPDWRYLEWPFKFKRLTRPPVICVSGQADRRANKVVKPPAETANIDYGRALYPMARRFPLGFLKDESQKWRRHHLFRGRSLIHACLQAHVSVLQPGHSPHPPHTHIDEELLIVLQGEAELILTGPNIKQESTIRKLLPGDFSYYPAKQAHTIRASGFTQLTYLMFRWSSVGTVNHNFLETSIIKGREAAEGLPARSMQTELQIEGPTQHLTRLHSHWSHVGFLGGYKAHRDSHDVSLVLISGRVLSGCKFVSAPAVLYFPAGSKHGLRGMSFEPAEYLAFEWHGSNTQYKRSGVLTSMAQRIQEACYYFLKTLRLRYLSR